MFHLLVLIFYDVVLTFDDLVLMFDICCQLMICDVLIRLMVTVQRFSVYVR